MSLIDKNLLLVTTIRNYPCLYNQGSSEYLKKDMTEKAWNEIASQVQLSVSECKEKWRNLRYSLLRSLKPNADGSSKKKYYLHDEMEFILPFMKTTKGPGLLLQFEDEIDEEVSIHDLEPGDSLQQQLCEYEFFIDPGPKKRKFDHQNQQAQKPVTPVTNSNDEISRKMFLLSLLPEVNTLTEFQMKIFRRKVFSLLDEITEPNCDDGENRKHTSSNEDPLLKDVIKTEPL